MSLRALPGPHGRISGKISDRGLTHMLQAVEYALPARAVIEKIDDRRSLRIEYRQFVWVFADWNGL